MEKIKGEINYVFWFVAILGIIRNITSILTSAMKLTTPEVTDLNGYLIYSTPHSALVMSIVASLLIIIFLILTLNKKRLGIYGFTISIFMFSIVSLAFYEDRLKQLPYNIGVALFQYILFFGLLMIKRNGIRSWYLFFPRKDITQSRNIDVSIQTKQESEGEAPHKEVESQDASSTTLNPATKNLTVTEKLVGANNTRRISSDPPKSRLHLQTVVIVFVVIAVLVGIVISIHLVHKYNQPEYQYAKADSLFKDGETGAAIKIYTKLADEKNYVKAKTRLGILYIDNDSVKPNYKLGIKYLTEASLSDTIALSKLFNIYKPETEIANGKYIDKQKLEKMAKEAINRRMLVGYSYYILGNIAAEKENFKLAYYNWDKATQHGERRGYDNIGWLFYNGYGCDMDDVKARRYFAKALEINSNDDYALFYLGLFYRYGYGVDVDLARAYKYLTKSADLGNNDAKKEVADMKMNESAVKLLGL